MGFVGCTQIRRRIQRYQLERQQRQPDAGWTEWRLNVPLLLVYDDAVCLLLFACEAFLWRGVWNLNATFLLSDLLVGGWVNHAAGTVIMMTLQLFSYVGICGCALDDDPPADEGTYANDRIRRCASLVRWLTSRQPCSRCKCLAFSRRWRIRLQRAGKRTAPRVAATVNQSINQNLFSEQ